MREIPILFSAPMVLAILEGRKTQTRRVVKPQPAGAWAAPGRTSCPYGQPGHRLWVRETWGLHDQGFDTAEESEVVVYRADADRPTPKRWRPSIHMPRWASRITLDVTAVRVESLHAVSEADALAEGIHRIEIGSGYGPRYSASPRAWSDAIEGHPDVQETAVAAFRELWESINGLGSWLANPWVWVVEFKRL